MNRDDEIELLADVKYMIEETKRTRERLHKLEPAVNGLLELQRVAIRESRRKEQKLGQRIQFLTVLVGIGSIAIPIGLHFVP